MLIFLGFYFFGVCMEKVRVTGNSLSLLATATELRPSVADWGDGVSASCTVGPIVR